MEKTVYLFMCHFIHKEILEEYQKIVKATENFGDSYLLFHLTKENQLSELVEYEDKYVFTNESLSHLKYPMFKNSLVPGSTHFPLLQYYLDYPQYDFYWFIEYDVRYSGDWKEFFQAFNDAEEDFITCQIRSYKDAPDWPWWELKHPTQEIALKNRYASFNPIYRVSNRALRLLDLMHQSGWRGHHEVLMATLFFHHGLKLRDLGGKGKFVKPDSKDYYVDSKNKYTVRWIPPFKKIAKDDHKLYHPVKPC